MKASKIIIAGGSGFLGNCIAEHFSNTGYHQVVILSRNPRLHKGNIRYVVWDAITEGAWTTELEGADVLINLTGKSVDCRYTKSNKELIYSSRIDATNVLGKAVKSLKNAPKIWINAASATIYRHALDREMNEETGEIGEGFSVDVCQKWESAFNTIEVPGTRKVVLRIGIVLGKNGGALAPLKQLAQFGVGGKQGDGNQFFSWLHEKDFVGIIEYIIRHDALTGIYNATSPNPVLNKQVMKTLRKVIGMPFGLPMPKWLLKLGAIIIRTESELILKSRRVIPKKLMQAGYKFEYEHIGMALAELVR